MPNRTKNHRLGGGPLLALGSAFLFGASTPIAKLLLGVTDPLLLAGLLYLGSGAGLALVATGARSLGLGRSEAPLRVRDLRWLGAIPLFSLLVTNVLLVRFPFFQVTLILQILFYGLALLGWCSASQRRKASGAISFPFFLVMVHVAALVGVVEVMMGRRFSVWESPAASRGVTPVEQQSAAGERL